jgi:hypothetical protein
MNIKQIIQKILNIINRLETEEIYDEDQLITRQQKIAYYLSLLNVARVLEYNDIRFKEDKKTYTCKQGDDMFRLGHRYYNNYEAAEKIIMENDIDDIRLSRGQVLIIK